MNAIPAAGNDQVRQNRGGYEIMQPYTSRFFDRQAPNSLTYAAALNGFAAPATHGKFRYCELGCGNGLTSIMLAAAYPEAEFTAVDFNARHIKEAQRLANAANISNIQFLACDFEQFGKSDVGQFDFITVHGVISWVDQQVRQELTACITQTLAPGGLVFLSYNAMPGCAAWQPFARIARFAQEDDDSGLAEQAKRGLDLLRMLRDGQAPYFTQNPSLSGQLDFFLSEDPVYVAHELLNSAFEPLYPADVFKLLAGADVDFAGSANLIHNHDIYTPAGQFQAYIQAGPDRQSQEIRRSLVRNDSFRNDIFRRRVPTVPPHDPFDGLARMIIGPVVPEAGIGLDFMARRQPEPIPQRAAEQMLPLFLTGSLTVAEIAHRPELRGVDPAWITEAVKHALLSEMFHPLQQPMLNIAHNESSKFELTSAINQLVLSERVRYDGYCPLTSQVLGSAILMPPLQSLLLWELCRSGDDKNCLELWQLLSQLPNPYVHAAVDQVWVECERQDFRRNWLPLLQRLDIVRPV